MSSPHTHTRKKKKKKSRERLFNDVATNSRRAEFPHWAQISRLSALHSSGWDYRRKKQKVILVTCGSEVVSQSCGTVKLSAPAAHRALVSLTSYSTPQPYHQFSAQQRNCDVAATTWLRMSFHVNVQLDVTIPSPLTNCPRFPTPHVRLD